MELNGQAQDTNALQNDGPKQIQETVPLQIEAQKDETNIVEKTEQDAPNDSSLGTDTPTPT